MSTPCLKFQRRADLSVQTRLLIGYQVIHQNSWGCVSRLACKYKVSRPFIYQTASTFSSLCADFFCTRGDSSPSKSELVDSSLRSILSLRLEGKCSLPSISTLMARQNLPHDSVGYISETLHSIGAQIGNTAPVLGDEGAITYLCFCSDELFAGGCPILITVEPISLLILRIELVAQRDGQTWGHHWEKLASQGIQPSLLVNDEGTGMKAAKAAVLGHTDRQSDTFHAVAYRLGLYVQRFLAIAYKAIGREYDCHQLLADSKTAATRLKRTEKYAQAITEAQEAITRYDDFVFLYHCLLECFQVFDKQGTLKEIEKVKVDFDTALDYLKEIAYKGLREEIKSIEACKNELFTFYKSAKGIVAQMAQKVESEVLTRLCKAWQCHKNALKAKSAKRQNACKKREIKILQELKQRLGNDYETTKNEVYQQLNHIIQSSAAIECINSLLRPYLNNAKNQVTQEFLNLFMFYHNNRCFKDGERKGKSPLQIATNAENQTDWIELLLKKIEK